MRTITTYAWHTGKLKKPLRIAVISDLHDEAHEDVWPLLADADCLLMPGDVANRYRQSFERGAAFLREAAKRLPTFVSPGNHEMRMRNREEVLRCFSRSGATFLFNRWVVWGELCIGGWYRPHLFDMADMMDAFEEQPGCKVLLCHRPEDYWKYLRGRKMELVLAGHAHGGQIRVREQGLYAPGQGLFPRYTKGVVDGRMIVSAGAGNPARMPRWGNPCELLRIELD